MLKDKKRQTELFNLGLFGGFLVTQLQPTFRERISRLVECELPLHIAPFYSREGVTSWAEKVVFFFLDVNADILHFGQSETKLFNFGLSGWLFDHLALQNTSRQLKLKISAKKSVQRLVRNG